MRRRRIIPLLLTLLLALSGCWDQREIEELNYMVAIGIDKGKKERLAVTFVLARPASGGEGGDKGDKGDKGAKGDKGEKGDSGGLITIEAPTLAGAVFHLNTVISRTTSLAQTKMIMLSEELARSEGLVILDEGARNRNIRRSTILVVTKQPVQQILKSLPPGPEGLNNFASVQTSAEPRRSGFLPVRTTLNDFLIRAATAYQQPVAYYAAITEPEQKKEGEGKKDEGGESDAKDDEKKDAGKESDKQEPTIQASSDRTIPGVSRRKGGPKVDFFGTAAFRRTKMVGLLDAEDTRALLLVQNSFRESTIEVRDPRAPKDAVGLRILTGRPTQVRAKLVDGRPQFDVKVTLEGEVIAMPPTADYTQPAVRQQLEAQVAEEVKQQVETFFKKTQEWGADVGGLGRRLVRKFPTVDAWEQFNWPDHYKTAAIQVSVSVQLRRFGVKLSPQTSRAGQQPK
jgi:spore germination protein KC